MFRRSKAIPRALREPDWAPLRQRRLPGASVQTHAWLADRGSLTRSVIASCRRRFAVDLIAQRPGRALPSEAALLDSGPAHANLVREVRLCCGGDPWVFARTVLPQRNLRGPVRALTRLGRRPLGEVLFADPTTRRVRVEVARITRRHHLFRPATVHLRRPPKVIWGRRTLFEFGGRRILVNEIFLPAIAELHR